MFVGECTRVEAVGLRTVNMGPSSAARGTAVLCFVDSAVLCFGDSAVLCFGDYFFRCVSLAVWLRDCLSMIVRLSLRVFMSVWLCDCVTV